MYHPTAEQAEADRRHAYETGIPHGYIAPGDKYKDLPTIDLMVQSELHSPDEYGANVDGNGLHSGGPFKISVSPKMRVDELRKVIYEKGGIIPALQRFSYAGKNLEDSQRTLEHYGIAYWNKKFPAWPLKIRRCKFFFGFSCIPIFSDDVHSYATNLMLLFLRILQIKWVFKESLECCAAGFGHSTKAILMSFKIGPIIGLLTYHFVEYRFIVSC